MTDTTQLMETWAHGLTPPAREFRVELAGRRPAARWRVSP